MNKASCIQLLLCQHGAGPAIATATTVPPYRRLRCTISFVASVIGVVIAMSAMAEDELPRDPPADSFEIEPPILIQNPQPDQPQRAQSSEAGEPQTSGQIEARLLRAAKAAADGQRLLKAGVLSAVEAEHRAMRVVRLEADLAKRRLEEKSAELEELEHPTEGAETTEAVLNAEKAAVADARAAAESAAAKLAQAEIEAAEANLRRQKKLVAAGIGRKADVNRASDQLSALKQRAE